ncbi:MAG: response regulator [Vicinamibacteria bacterium]|nr:response regulator [Vicinamibacteria bacterium]
MKRKRSSVSIAVFLVFLGLGLLQYLYFPARQHETLSRALQEKAVAISELAAHDAKPGLDFRDDKLVRDVFHGAARDPDLRYIALFDEQGALYVEYNPAALALHGVPRAQKRTITSSDGRMLHVSTPVHLDSGPGGAVIAGFSMDGVMRESRNNRNVALLIGVALLGVGMSTALWIGRAIVRIERLAEEAQAASRAKSDFLANISHEIRTPMNGVLGMISLLRGTSLDERQSRFASQIQTSGEALLEIINDVLDFSKIEAGKLKVEEVEFDLVERVEDLVIRFAGQAQAKGIDLLCDIAPTVPQRVKGDPLRLLQILTNLIGNAIKFTNQGHVYLRVRVGERVLGQPRVNFEVEDTGVGIPLAAQKRLFQAFTQADTSTTRQYGGTGLGLVIARQLAELMGGRIELSSAPNVGSVFTLQIPMVSVVTAPESETRVELSGRRALIVDDDEANRLILDEVVRSWGLVTEQACDGREALSCLNRKDSGIDVLITDRSMPEMDGLELIQTLKGDPVLGNLPVVLLTSLTDEDPQLFRKLGVSAYLPKPIKRSALLQAIETAIHGAEAVATLNSDAGGGVVRMGRRREDQPLVLVVEDNVTNQEVMVALLEHLGYRSEVAGNGLVALERLCGEHPFCAALMDCQMPELDGYTATRRLREWERANNRERLPIIAVTAHALQDDRDKVIHAGMDDYITKPVRPATLAALLEKWVPLSERLIETPVEHKPPEPPVYERIDRQIWTGLRQLQSPRRPDFLRNLIDCYLKDAATHVAAMREALAAQDPERLRTAAHTLKGSSRNVGARRLGAVCEHLQDNGLVGAEALLDEAEQELDCVRPLLLAMIETAANPASVPLVQK